MKVYAVPTEVPAPKVDYTNYDWKAQEKLDVEHSEKLKEHLIGLGYTGSRTGEILRIGHADGYAAYMYADAPKGSCLIHLPYGDGWHSPQADYMSKKAVLVELDQAKKRKKLFGGV